jgi:glycerol-3-phosphate acyltransferase PlsX
MAGGTLKLRPLEGVDRPAIGSIMPGKERHFVMIDAGANPESRPEHLLHNAVLGRDYAQIVLKIDQPKVGLLTIGTEEGKGTERISRTHRLLKMAADEGLITYSGLIEGFQLFDNHVDVVVCDGFTGNVVLKACEGLFKFMSHVLREEMTANPIRSLGAALCKGAFLDLRERMSPEAFGGAPLLGLRGNILKAHGSANRHAIVSAIRIARELARHELVRQSREDIARVNRCLQSTSAITPATAS